MALKSISSGFFQEKAFRAYLLAYSTGGLTTDLLFDQLRSELREDCTDHNPDAFLQAVALGTHDRQTGREPRGPEFFTIPDVKVAKADEPKPSPVAWKITLDPKVSEPAPNAAQTLRDLDEQVKAGAVPHLAEKLEAAAIAKEVETRIDRFLIELGRPSGRSTAASEYLRELVVRELAKKDGAR